MPQWNDPTHSKEVQTSKAVPTPSNEVPTHSKEVQTSKAVPTHSNEVPTPSNAVPPPEDEHAIFQRKIDNLDPEDPVTKDLNTLMGKSGEFTYVYVHPETRELLTQLNTPGFGNPFFTFEITGDLYTMTAKAGKGSNYRHKQFIEIAKLIYELLPPNPMIVLRLPGADELLAPINQNFKKLQEEIEKLKPKNHVSKALGFNANARRLIAAAPEPSKSDLFERNLDELKQLVSDILEARVKYNLNPTKTNSHRIDGLVGNLEKKMRALRRLSTAPEIKEYEEAIKPAEKYSKFTFVGRKTKHGNAGGRRTRKKNVR